MNRMMWIVTLSVAAALSAPLPAATSQRPNFVFILGEGHGWSSTSVRMDDAVAESKSSCTRTPNFEKLAQTGMRFANFYAPSPRCTPSRATFFTGKSPAQLHMTFVGEGKKDSGGSGNTRMLPLSSNTATPPTSLTVPDSSAICWLPNAHTWPCKIISLRNAVLPGTP